MNYHEGIERALGELETLAESIAGQALDAARAEAAYKIAASKSRLAFRAKYEKRTVGEIEDNAMLECEELYMAHLIANAMLDASRQALRATQARLDGLRTLAAGVRSITN